jgi:hypothetical protein
MGTDLRKKPIEQMTLLEKRILLKTLLMKARAKKYNKTDTVPDKPTESDAVKEADDVKPTQ